MSIFPLKKSSRGCTFKLSIDEVCAREGDVSKGAWLPCLGFTEKNPSAMDTIGGLPTHIECTAQSICLRGDGSLFRTENTEEHLAEGDANCIEQTSGSSYVVKAGDVLECFWGSGKIKVSVQEDDGDNVIYEIKSKSIPKPPKKPLYAIIDCCHAASKTTLLI